MKKVVYFGTDIVNRVLDLWADGCPTAEIAKVCGIKNLHSVTNIVNHNRLHGDPRAVRRFARSPRGKKKSFPITIAVNQVVHDAVSAEAKRRGVTPVKLVETIVTLVGSDGLFAAVLDD